MAVALIALLACLSPATLLAVRDEDTSTIASLPHVCCMDVDKFKIYDPKIAHSEIKNCKLLSFINKRDCGANECERKCEEDIKGTKAYAELKKEEAMKALEKAEKDAGLSRAKMQRDSIKVSADKEYKDAVKRADERLDFAKTDYDAKSAALESAKQAFELATAALDKAPASREQAMEQAAAAKAKKEEEATNAVKMAEALIKEKSELADAASKEAEMRNPPEIPKICAASATCCCSVQNVPVRVNTATFLDWDKCRGAKPYPESWRKYGRNCDFMDECDFCREEICGKSMCP